MIVNSLRIMDTEAATIHQITDMVEATTMEVAITHQITDTEA